MRTTLEIDEDVLAAARSLATAEGRSIGAALSSLARKGLRPATESRAGSGGFPVFDVASSGRPITSEMVRVAQNDDPPDE